MIPTFEQRHAAETKAILSSCCGVLGEVTLTDSAIIILFTGMLGAGDMFAMITTSLLPLFNGICVIPMAWLATRQGNKRLIIRACTLSATMYFVAVASPFFGHAAAPVLLTAIVLFAFFQTGFIAGWFPLLDTFLTPERRTGFFGRMRFCHQLTAVAFLFLVGCVIGKAPPLWVLQVVLLIGAIIFVGRMCCIAGIPVFEIQARDDPGFRNGLTTAIRNKPLIGFSIYLFALNVAAYGTVPLTMIYLKTSLRAPDNAIVIISAAALFGMLLGYFGAGRLIQRLGTGGVLLGCHAVLVAVNVAMFLVGHGSVGTYVVIAGLLLVYNFAIAAASIVASAEMMALATPGNKAMAMACNGAFYYGGFGLSRLGSSLIMGSGMLAAEWSIGSMRVTHYQTLFLLYAVAIVFAAVFLLMVPAIVPASEPPSTKA